MPVIPQEHKVIIMDMELVNIGQGNKRKVCVGVFMQTFPLSRSIRCLLLLLIVYILITALIPVSVALFMSCACIFLVFACFHSFSLSL